MLRIITQSSDILQELQRLQERHRPPSFSLIATVLEQLTAFKQSPKENLLSQTAAAPRSGSLRDRPLRVSGSRLDAAYQRITPARLEAIRQACEQLDQVYRQQLPTSQVTFGDRDLVKGQRYYPVKRAGFYLENKRGDRLSNLLRQGMLAKVVGVRERVLVTPGEENGEIAPDILVAAQEMGIEEIYQLGGVMAIAALAFGTASLAPVASITGAGSAMVMAAKQLVSTWVKIDPALERTDLMILVADQANPQLVALDLLAYAEQDPQASLVILSDRQSLAEQISHWVTTYCREQEHSIHTEKAIAHYGLIGVVENLTACLDWVNQFEPYTLMLSLADPWSVVEKVQRAQEIYIGQNTPTPFGDYLSGAPRLRYRDGDFRSATQLALSCFLQPCQLLDYGSTPSPDWLSELVKSEDLTAIEQRLRFGQGDQD